MEDLDVQIGNKLRDAREAAGYTVTDVVHRAHLPRSVIEALEAEDFSVFTSPTYAKSFLNQYSAFLNVDAHPWLDALEPTSFGQTEGLHSIFETLPALHKVELPRSKKESGNSAFSTILLMVITGGILYGAYKGLEMAEKIWGGIEKAEAEEKPQIVPKPEAAFQSPPSPGNPPQVPAAVIPNPPSTSAEPIIVKKQEILPGPPPKAIPVVLPD